MGAVRYGPAARFSDWWHGWRDGRRGVPTTGAATTPHRSVLLRRAQEEFEHERLRHEAAWVEDLAELNAQTAAREHAQERWRAMKVRLAQVAEPLTEEHLTARRPGEERRRLDVVRLRRSREQGRAVAAAQRAERAAQAAVESLDKRIASLHQVIGRRLTVAEVRLRRLHQHTHRRLASYLRRLVRSHPAGPRVLEGVDVLEPRMPEWARTGPGEREPERRETPPSVRPTGPDVRVFALGDRLTIGSSESADVVLNGYHVAAEHAVVARHGGQVELRDLGHGDGTFQNGRSVRRTTLRGGAVFDIADHRFHLSEDLAELSVVALGPNDLVVHRLSATSVRTGGPFWKQEKTVVTRLTEMSFVHRERSVLAILGPSGAGKSSLFSALLGELTPSSGRLFFQGLHVADHLEQMRSRLGFVPQDDNMHRSLTVRQLLEYAHRLRRPSDVRDNTVVEEVAKRLNIAPRLDQSVHKLSGGQRKRVSVALEVLSRPRMLMLDEPTSGLDPGMDRDVMRMLRGIAADDCTVIVVTHATEHLNLADQVLVVGKEGRPVFCGPPTELPQALGCDNWADLMKTLEDEDELKRLAGEYVAGPMAERAARAADAIVEPREPEPEHVRGPRTAFLHQFPVLVARQIALTFPVLGSRNLPALVASLMPVTVAAVSALLAAVVTGDEGLGAGPQTAGPTALSILVTLSVLTGQALTYSNLVEEYPVLVREHRTGMVTAAVVLSKWLVFAFLAVVQGAVAVGVFVLIRPGPVHGVTGLPSTVELAYDLALTSVAAMSLGLLVSAWFDDLKKAVTVTSLAVIAQVALNGVTTNLSADPMMNAIAMVWPARWGLSASASTVDLRTISPVSPPDELWQHGVGQWVTDIGALGLLTALYAVGAIVVLHRRLTSAKA